jgi:hypothetical protein
VAARAQNRGAGPAWHQLKRLFPPVQPANTMGASVHRGGLPRCVPGDFGSGHNEEKHRTGEKRKTAYEWEAAESSISGS